MGDVMPTSFIEFSLDSDDVADSVNEHPISAFIGPRVWGFGLIRAWVYLMFLGMGVGVLTQVNDAYAPTVYLWSSIALTITLFSGALAPERLELVLLSLRGQIFAIVLTVIGTVLALLAFFVPYAADPFAVAGGVATGVGSGLIHLGYGEIHRDHPPSEVGIEVPMAVLVAAVLFAVISTMPYVVQAVVVSLLPVVSGVIMATQQRSLSEAQLRASLKVRSGLILPTPKLIVRVGLCACGIGLADGIARQVFMSIAGVSSVEYYHPAMLTSSVILAVILVGFELLRRDNTFRGLYKLITFVIAASIAFMPSLVGLPDYLWLGPLITLIGYNAFNAFVWILLSDLTYNFRLSAAATFGMGWGMLTLGSTAGQMLGASLSSSGMLGPQVISLIAAVSTLGIFAVCLFVMKDNDLVDIQDAQAMVESVGLSMGDDGFMNNDNSIGEFVSLGDASSTVESEFTSEEEPTSGYDKKTAAISEDTVPHDQPNNQDQRAPFRERCTRLARECGLTPRETEILILFAKGRSAARIQEELVISRGTVTTHLQHIYRKADVHSKQELLDAIERQKL